jgi:hypothetical protein
LLEEQRKHLTSEEARLKYFEERAENMVKHQIMSPLFAPHYYPEDPDPYKDEIELYRRYGFYWPTKEDIVQLSIDHKNFTLDDLVIKKIRFKREGCGFTMLQLEFAEGILSPVFMPRLPEYDT